MTEPTLHRRNFLLHLQKRSGYGGPVLIKEPAREQPSLSHAHHLHNEYAVTCKLAGVAGVRPALAKEGTESRPALLLEYIEGQSLTELIRSVSPNLADKLRLAVKIAEVLRRIHDHQVVHKDVNSGNILVADGDSPGSFDGVYIIDFGISLATGKENPTLLAADDKLVGTLAYVSPEQTGRMNRQVDSRSDLYSLGVTLYELFTGQLPFDRRDVLELIHDHIARQPEPPHEIQSGIPVPVSDIILRLLAKDPDDRYQTARGLHTDLETSLDQWRRQGRIEPFELGGHDLPSSLNIPQKLYGRQAEIEHLRSILNRAVSDQAQLLLVAGYSGVGKTSLVREIQKNVIENRGTYIEGKFDQVKRTIPYSAWRQALTLLVDNWLAQSETSIAGWRDTVLNAVGDHGQVLIDVIPALERILGPQPEVPRLGGVENQNRINYFFSRFLTSLATPEHPLVVFLDDLQWIDPASLKLIEALFAGEKTSCLLVVGAYRSNEVEATHPLAISQGRLQVYTDRVTILTLAELSPDATNHLLADSLRLGVADCRDLGLILTEKSAGNPLFYRQLLTTLVADGQLEFDRDRCRWTWTDDIGRHIRARGSVVDLMVEKIQALSPDTQRALSVAACIGSRFDLQTVHTIVERPWGKVLNSLDPALQGGLILQSDGHFLFAHDRIQECAYSLIPESDRPKTHLEIGRILLARTPIEGLGQEIFSLVNHLNAGRALIDLSDDRTELAALNLGAAQRARTASAFVDAKRHVEIGLELLGQDPWQDQYELTLSLHSENAELALMTGRPDDVSASAERIRANGRNSVDQVRAYVAQINAEISHYRPAKALQIGLRVLDELGARIPAKPDSGEIRRLNRKLLDLLTDKPLDAVARLRSMTDETALAASSILAAISPASYMADPTLVPLINYKGALLTAEYGYNSWSALFFARLALVAFSAEGHGSPDEELRDSLETAKQMQALSRNLLKIPASAPSHTKALHMLAMTAHWTEPIDRALDIARATYKSGLETGDMLHSAYGCLHTANHGLAAGLGLDSYRTLINDHVQFCNRVGQQAIGKWLSIFLQTAQRFQKESPEPVRLIGAYFNEEDWLPGAEEAGDIPGQHFLSLLKLLLSYHFDVDGELDECILKSEQVLAGGVGMVSYAIFYFYSSLARVRLAGQLKEKNRAEAVQRTDGCLRLIRFWAETTPSTFQHKGDLIAAERARVEGDLEAALSHYEGAIGGARASGFIHEEALANELFARYWAERGHDRFAGPLMREAQSLYLKWGAQAKAEHLTERFPGLLPGPSIVVDRQGAQGTSDVITDGLDLRTVLKASQDIASELRLDSLLARLMTDVIENTGAQKGFLILEKGGRWMIAARASVDDPEPFSRTAEDIAGTDLLAEGVVHYVARKQVTVVLDDASKSGRFVHHEYIRKHRVKSILCTPLVNQGKTSAILYLENDLAPGVFSMQRVSLLRLLSSQMAISIDNARVHATLENLLEQRSQALASAEAQIRTLFENSPLAIALSSPEGKILTVNSAFLEMMRVKEEELPELSVVGFYDHPNDRAELLRRVEETGFVEDFGVQIVRADGSRFHANLSMSKLVLEGNEVLLGMAQDVTSQITAEQEAAVLQERARLARELHDAVTQTVLSASMLADASARRAAEDRTIETRDLAKLSGMLHGALDEMRTLLLDMRPAAARERTLGQFLTAMVEAATARSPAKVNLRIVGDRLLPESVTMQLQRIAQESVNNSIRHSRATTLQVDLVCDPDGVELRITDDGCGFDVNSPSAGHHGLSIMRERAQEIGAVLEVHSTIDEGTVVSVAWS